MEVEEHHRKAVSSILQHTNTVLYTCYHELWRLGNVEKEAFTPGQLKFLKQRTELLNRVSRDLSVLRDHML